jgi:outer membrane protein TolC
VAITSFGQVTNSASATAPGVKVVPLSLEEAIQRTLQSNLELQINRLDPLIIGYDIQALYGGYYDPTFSSSLGRANGTEEGGGFNTITGQPTPPSKSQTDSFSTTLGGWIPTGLRYDLYNNVREHRNDQAIANTNGAGFAKSSANFWTADAGIRVSQPLLRGLWTDLNRTAIKLRKKDRKISELALEQSTLNKVGSVVSAYYDLVGKLETIKVREAELQVKVQLADETRRKVEVGTLAPLEEKKAQAEVARTRTALVQAQDAADSSEAALRAIISDNYINELTTRITPTDKLVVVPARVELQESLRAAMDRRLDLQQERERLAQQDIRLKYTFNQLFPQLDLFASWGVNGLDKHRSGALNDLDHTTYEQDSYGISLSFGLSSWSVRNQHKAAKLTKAKAILTLKSVEENIIKDVDDQVRAVRSAFMRVGLTRDTVAFAEADLEAEQKKLAAGKSTSFFVLDAASRLASARSDAIQAMVDYNLSLNSLARAEGTLLEQRKIDFQSTRKLEPVRP